MAKLGEFASIMEQERQCAPDSSMITRVEYEYASQTMYVIFNTGRVYGYEAVPEQTFDALCKANSAGQFFNRNIRNIFRFTQLA
jgi:hypothetical protein